MKSMLKFSKSLVVVSLCVAGLWAATSPSAGAQSSASNGAPATAVVRPAQIQVVSRELPNGLKLVMVEDHRTPIVSLQVWYHVGSKDERPGRTGFAHLFEHLMFRGSTHVGPEQHFRIIESMGGVNNAYTTEDVTVYYETVPSNYLARTMWLEADRMGGLNISQENFDAELEVVKEERRLRYDNTPYGRVWEDLGAAAFTVHPYRHSVIGSMEDLDKATVEDVREFFQAYYRPDNATLVLVGDISPDEAVRLAQQYFGGIERPKQPIARINATEPPQKAERRLTKSYDNTPLPAVFMGYRMPANFAPDSYPLDIASNILSSGQSSMLYRKLVYEDRLATQVSAGGNFTEDPNLFMVLAVMNQGKTPAEGEKAIESVLDRLKTAPVEARDLEKAKNQQIASIVLRRQRVDAKAGALGLSAVVGKDVNLVNTELDRYLKVSAADIQRAARQYLVPTQRTVLVIEPPKEDGQDGGAEMTTRWMRRAGFPCWPSGVGGAELGNLARSGANAHQWRRGSATVPGVKLVPEMPAAAAPRPFAFPASVSRTLPNGLRVFVVSARARGAGVPVDPALSVELLIRNAGTARDPQGKPGLAEFTAGLLDRAPRSARHRKSPQQSILSAGPFRPAAGAIRRPWA